MKANRLLRWSLALLMAVTARLGTAGSWAPPGAADALRREMADFFAGCENREPGSPGNRTMEARIDALFAASGFAHGEIRFPASRFIPGPASLTLDNGVVLPLHAMHPTWFRPGNFTERRFATHLVYLGQGDIEDLAAVSGTDLDGAIALLDFQSGAGWEQLLRFGLRGFVFIGAPDMDNRNAVAKVSNSEVAVPRYYVGPEDGKTLLAACGAARACRVTVEAVPSRWEKVELRDLWVIVPGADAAHRREMPVVTAPIDGACAVPGLGQGARNGANLFLLVKLLEAFRDHPPARSLMLAAVNGHTQFYLGERLLAWNLLAPSSQIEEVRNTLSADRRMQELLAGFYETLKLDGSREKEDRQLLIDMRTLADDSIGRWVSIKDPIVALAKRDVNELKGRRARLEREKDSLRRELRETPPAAPASAGQAAETGPARIASLQAEIDALAVKQARHVNVLILFNKVGALKTTLDRLTAGERAILKGYVDEIVRDNRQAAELNRRDLAVSLANGAIRQAAADYTIPFAITLELTWANEWLGFSSLSDITRRWGYAFGGNASRIAGALDDVATGRKPNLLTDTLTYNGGLPETHYIQTASPAPGFFQGAGQLPAFSLNTVFSDFGPVFTPLDTFAGLDYDRVAQIAAFTPAFFRALLADPVLTRSSDLLKPPADLSLWSLQVKTFRFDEFAASVLPQIPVPGSVVLIYPTLNRPRITGDVPGVYMAQTDERAAAVVYGIKERSDDDALASAAYRLDPDFIRVDQAIDAGEAHLKVNSNVIRQKSLILSLFPCAEFPIRAFDDTSLIYASSINRRGSPYLILSGGKNSAPRKFGLTGMATPFSDKRVPRQMTGPAAVYLQPGDRIKLLTGEKRLALNATPREPEGAGFSGVSEMGSDFFFNAVRDMSVLNAARIRGMKGVTDDLARHFLETGDAFKEHAIEAIARRDHPAYLRNLFLALGAQVKAYAQTTAATHDMLKAVLFFMALLLPFCFFLEKLLFTTSRIEVEMGVFAILFAATFLLFRVIHPAFRVARYPEAIFLGFVMGALGLFVIGILHGRFEGEMQLLLKNLSASEFAEAGYSSVSQQAMLIGVNNMKRRRIRTALTTGTIVLVTFTMLAFTSISRRMNPTLVSRHAAAPYTGLMFHWPGNARMDEGTRFAIRALFADQGDVIERQWLLPEKMGGAAIPIRLFGPNGKSAMLDGILGLMPQENGFLQPMPMVAGRFFTSDSAREVILPASLAQVLGIAEAGVASVTLMGTSYTVAGILDDERFRAIQDINGRALLPIKDLVQQGGTRNELDASRPEISEEEMDETGVFYADTSALLLMPARTARQIGAEPYSLSIRLRDEKSLWNAVTTLLTATAAKFYIASREPFAVAGGKGKAAKPGVYFIGAGYRTSIGGLSMLIVPLLIAATIILNTMLGSVVERKKEIAIYNAVGLNPTHIGLFFLAESFVYGVIGSVGGYLIGQFLSLALNRFGLVSDIHLNFSSLSVAYVILFTLSVVLLSTLYPAAVATKAAVPSGKRKWSLPPNDGTTMTVVFPFIYQPALLPGIMRYLEDYFGQFTEASTGDLIARLDRKTLARDARGRPVYTLDYHIALAPFDLGVTQRIAFEARYDDVVQSFRVTLTAVRVSGQDSNWISTNKPFLEKLRQHLLQWRNLDAGQHALFVRRGQDSFA